MGKRKKERLFKLSELFQSKTGYSIALNCTCPSAGSLSHEKYIQRNLLHLSMVIDSLRSFLTSKKLCEMRHSNVAQGLYQNQRCILSVCCFSRQLLLLTCPICFRFPACADMPSHVIKEQQISDFIRNNLHKGQGLSSGHGKNLGEILNHHFASVLV